MYLLSTQSLEGYGLDKVFTLAKQAQVDGLDLSVDFDQFDTFDAAYLDTLVARHSLPIVSITAPTRRLTKKHLDTILELAESLGVQIVNLLPPHRLDKEKDWFGEYLQKTLEKYRDITLNITNAPPKTWLFVIAEYGDARPETIKKITGHTALSIQNVEPESGVDLMKTFILMGNTIGLVYLSDKNEESDTLYPGEGGMPLESLLIKMHEAGYNGHFSLIVKPEALSAGEDAEVVARIEWARKYLEKYFR